MSEEHTSSAYTAFDAFTSFDVDMLRLVLNICDLCDKYYQLPYTRRMHFIEQLQDEYAPMDDEYSDIVDSLILSLYKHCRREHLEQDLHTICARYHVEKVEHVMQAMLDTIHDHLYDNPSDYDQSDQDMHD